MATNALPGLAGVGMICAALAGLTAPIRADDGDKLTHLFEALFRHMAGTYVCREVLGGMARYQVARSIAIDEMSPYVGEDQAVLYVDQMDKKLKADPRVMRHVVDDAKCIEVVDDTLSQIKAAKAKLEM